MMRALLAGSVLVVAGCATTPKEDPVQLRLDDLDARVGRIDRVVSNNSLVQLSQQIEAQQQELRQLRGRIDELQNDNAKLRQEQRGLYADLDKRLAETRAAASAPTPLVGGPSTGQGPADEQAQYERALEMLRTRDYAGATDTLRALVAAYPNGQLADNTQYWLGEAYYVTQDYEHATAAFQRVLTAFPNSRKVPDALLKLGYTQLEQGNTAAARTTLQQVVTRHPGTDAARLASERLARLPRQ